MRAKILNLQIKKISSTYWKEIDRKVVAFFKLKDLRTKEN